MLSNSASMSSCWSTTSLIGGNSYNASDVNGRSFFFEDPCNISLINASSFCCFAYTLFIVLLYIKCSSYSDNTGRKYETDRVEFNNLFFGHAVRVIFSLILLTVHLAEFSIIILFQERPQGLSGSIEITAALLTWILSQLFYAKLESIEEPRYVVITAVFWLLCSVTRCIQMNYVSSVLGLGPEYVRFYTSLLSMLLCASLALCDLATIVYQIKLQQSQRTSYCNVENQFHKNYSKSTTSFHRPKSSDHPSVTRTPDHGGVDVGPLHNGGFENDDSNCSYSGGANDNERSGHGFNNNDDNYVYRHSHSNWYSKVTFCWLNGLLKAGYVSPLELEDLGVLPSKERAKNQFNNFYKLWNSNAGKVLWLCYAQLYWKNFIIGGILKLLGDCVGFVGPLGIAVVIKYISSNNLDGSSENNSQGKIDSSLQPSRNGSAITLHITKISP